VRKTEEVVSDIDNDPRVGEDGVQMLTRKQHRGMENGDRD
jgi:hypothetical protein